MDKGYSVLVQVLEGNEVLYRESVIGIPTIGAAVEIAEKANDKMRLFMEIELPATPLDKDEE